MGILRDTVEKVLTYLERGTESASCLSDMLALGLKADDIEAKSSRTGTSLIKDQPVDIKGVRLPNVTVADLVTLMTVGYIVSIKEHRARTGFGLKESKDAIDRLVEALPEFKRVSNVVLLDQWKARDLLNNTDAMLARTKKPRNIDEESAIVRVNQSLDYLREQVSKVS